MSFAGSLVGREGFILILDECLDAVVCFHHNTTISKSGLKSISTSSSHLSQQPVSGQGEKQTHDLPSLSALKDHRIPVFQLGDGMNRIEFERRYSAVPDVAHAELVVEEIATLKHDAVDELPTLQLGLDSPEQQVILKKSHIAPAADTASGG